MQNDTKAAHIALLEIFSDLPVHTFSQREPGQTYYPRVNDRFAPTAAVPEKSVFDPKRSLAI
jgi:hypothetical protein